MSLLLLLIQIWSFHTHTHMYTHVIHFYNTILLSVKMHFGGWFSYICGWMLPTARTKQWAQPTIFLIFSLPAAHVYENRGTCVLAIISFFWTPFRMPKCTQWFIIRSSFLMWWQLTIQFLCRKQITGTHLT